MKKDIAVIGIACRFPGASNYHEYWLNLLEGKNSIREIPPDRWSLEDFYSPDIEEPNRSISKWCGIVEGIDLFDNKFFSISPREAKSMDPQQRLLLEETWRCIEDSGVSLTTLQSHKTSVFVGVMSSDYSQGMSAAGLVTDSYSTIGNYDAILSNRISYALGFNGTSLTINAACAASLVALHNAKAALRTGESDFSIAAGVNLNTSPLKYISFSKARMLSPDGRCKTFDKDANGYVPGDGIGVVLLQPLEDALKDGNHIYGIIKGSAVNHGGQALTITAPKVEAQQEVILNAYKDAEIRAETVTYVEAHGTGTSLGDPIEVEALTRAFRQYTEEKHFCYIGSVKTNIGHLEGAAGIAGIIKVLLMMQASKIAPTLNIRTLNPVILFDESPFLIASTLEDWVTREKELPLRAGVSSFGFGGVNAHAIVEDFPIMKARALREKRKKAKRGQMFMLPAGDGISGDFSDHKGRSPDYLFMISGKTPKALSQLIDAWKGFIERDSFYEFCLQDICATLMTGRESYACRHGCRIHTKSELIDFIKNTPPVMNKTIEEIPCSLRLGNMTFNGFEGFLPFIHEISLFNIKLQETINRFDKVLSQEIKKNLKKPVWPKDKQRLFSFLTAYTSIATIMETGFKPSLIFGERDGLLLSLTLSGMVCVEDVVFLLEGSKKLHQIKLKPPDIPFYDPLSKENIMPFHFTGDYLKSLIRGLELPDEVFRANQMQALLLKESQPTFKKFLNEWNLPLNTSAGRDMDSLLNKDALATQSDTLPEKGRLLLMLIIDSCRCMLDRKWDLTRKQSIADPGYHELLDLLIDGVLTKEDVINLCEGKDNNLDTIAKSMNRNHHFFNKTRPYGMIRKEHQNLSVIPDMDEWFHQIKSMKTPSLPSPEHMGCIEFGEFSEPVKSAKSLKIPEIHIHTFKDTLLYLWLNHVDIAWHMVYPEGSFEKVSLPVYEFDRASFWLNREVNQEKEDKRQRLRDSLTISPTAPLITSHVIRDHTLIPGAYMIEIGIEALERAISYPVHSLKNIVFKNPGVVDKTMDITLDINLQNRRFTLKSGALDLCEGEYRYPAILIDSSIDTMEMTGEPTARGKELYEALNRKGYHYGEALRVIQNLWQHDDSWIFELAASENIRESDVNAIQIAQMDGMLQALLMIEYVVNKTYDHTDSLHLPYMVKALHLNCAYLPDRCFVRIKERDILRQGGDIIVTIGTYNERGECLCKIDSVVFKQTVKADTVWTHDERERPDQFILYRIKEELAAIVAQKIDTRPDKINHRESFFTLGIDSILLKETMGILEKKYDNLPATLLFEYPNIDKLAAYLKERLAPKEIDRLTSEFGAANVPKEKKEPPTPQSIEVNEPVVENADSPIVFSKSEPKQSGYAIAIIGVSGRFPKSPNLAAYWDNLISGRDCIEDIPPDRWNHDLYFDPDPDKPDSTYGKWGGFMTDVDKFDPLFFNISPREARQMDPQQRLFLECVWHTMEDGGYGNKRRYSDKTVGLYVGMMWNEYSQISTQKGFMNHTYVGPGSLYWIIANRVSYFMDFKGPSIAIDTACSSSLAAIHLACQSILNKESDMAIAGGVNLSIHPEKYIYLAQGRFLSKDGRCRSFGRGGSGYVPGEGVGAVLLKPLSRAIQDHDPVYAIIRGTSINHGGKTAGFTVPNPKAQSDLIQEALHRANVSAEDLSYIECHGTGTSLGDPIEIQGLTGAFRKYTDKNEFCPIGSVKSNIGHLEASAGIAGLIKILLALKHEAIPISLHSEEKNPTIDFSQTPFYVVNETIKWKSEDKGSRKAGISSFGAGGSNAHAIIESFEEDPAASSISQVMRPVLIPISAKNRERLHAYIDLFITFFSGNPQISLVDAAYTLQIGREEMEERVALVVSEPAEVVEKLTHFHQGRVDVEGLHYGAPEGKGPKGQDHLKRALHPIDLKALAELWISGAEIDWNQLYPDKSPHTVSLPTYPFAGERYWVVEKKEDLALTDPVSVLHPLLDTNESTLQEQCFQKTLKADHFYIKDHIVKDDKILPGAAYLEMAITAGSLSNREVAVNRILNTTWLRPLVVSKDVQTVKVGLYPGDQDVRFEVFSVNEDGQRTLYSQGALEYIKDISAPEIPERVNRQSIMDRCRQTLDKAQCYKLFKDYGLSYGPGFQVIEELYINSSEAISKLMLPKNLSPDFSQYTLHPSIIDGAFQSILGLIDFSQTPQGVYVPYLLEELTFVNPLTETVYAYVRKRSSKENERDRKFDIQIIDETGDLLIDLKGLWVRSILPKDESLNVLYYQTVWETFEVDTTPQDITGLTLLFDLNDEIYTVLRDLLSGRVIRVKPGARYGKPNETTYEINSEQIEDYQRLLSSIGELPEKIIYLWAYEEDSLFHPGDIEKQLETGIYALFHLTKSLTGQRISREIEILWVYKEALGDIRPCYAGLGGFARTLIEENPKLKCKTLALPQLKAPDLSRMIIAQLNRPDREIEVRYTEDQRFVKKGFKKIDSIPEQGTHLKERGLYIITGGAGGIGLLFAGHIINTSNSRVVLAGRSDLSDEKTEAIQRLGQAVYIKADVSTRAGAEALIKEVKTRYGSINGIIHSAGVLRDSLLVNKTKEDLETVLGPKVYGAVYLDQATKDENLDFFVLFSSITAILGNPGQADYAYGNSFIDAFAIWRQKHRKGKTLAINWPLWAEGGMHVSRETMAWMKGTRGFVPLETSLGMKAFFDGLTMTHPQIIVLSGDKNKITKTMEGIRHQQPDHPQASLELTKEEVSDFKEKARGYLKTLLSKQIDLDPGQIKADEPLDRYGIDSVMIMSLTRALEKRFGELSKTLFFEYHSIEALSEYFVENHSQQLLEEMGTEPPAKARHDGSDRGFRPRFTYLSSNRAADRAGDEGAKAEEIAIIGLGGRYPKADDPEAFWENLKTGRDCITEIPETRWDYREYADFVKGKWGGFIDDIDKFDPLFFNISPREADLMDPQERLFLETVWHTLEDAAYTKSSLWGRSIGVYVGVMYGEYQLLGAEETLKGNLMASSASFSSIANRVSYFLNLTGPSIAIDTMCSSSLTAIHLACESIQKGESEMAIAGGVNLLLHPQKYILLAQSNFLSSDGRCRAFGRGGDGYVPGEGVGAVLLKPLHKAIGDKDRIYGVIMGTSINHGGKTNGFTVPNPNAQGNVIARALRSAKVDPKTITYMEAHGTGTQLGDPIEITGLGQAYNQAFQGDYEDTGRCAIGSVKSNIGHLESAAGIAGLTKVLLQMKHRQIVPSIHSGTLNPNINFLKTPFKVQQTLEKWEPLNPGEPRTAGISSFGAGGSNAHVIVASFEDSREVYPPTTNKPVLIVLSAKNEERLKVYVRRLLTFIDPAIPLSQIAYTLQIGREAMEERLALIVSTHDELKEKLSQYEEGRTDIENYYSGNTKKSKSQNDLLIEGEEGREFVRIIARDRRLTKLARLWVSGVEINWELLYGSMEERPGGISLPTYPFAKERYWVPTSSQKLTPTMATKEPERDTITYISDWVRSRNKQVVSEEEKPDRVNLVVFNPEGFDFEQTIVSNYKDSITIRLGGQIRQVSDKEWEIDFRDPNGWEKIIHESPPISTLYFLGGLSKQHMDQSFPPLQQEQEMTVITLFRCIKALIKVGYDRQPLHIVVLTQDVQPLFEGQRINPRSSALSGFTQSLAKEQPGWHVRHIDLSGEDLKDRNHHPAILSRIRQEGPDPEGIPVAYRQGYRYTRQIYPVSLPKPDKPNIRRQGVYVILGGAGGLGLVFSEYFIKTYDARMVWLGRRAVDKTISDHIERLRQYGTYPPLYIQADGGSPEQMYQAVVEIKRAYGSINGVIHSAIVLKDKTLGMMNETEFIEAFLPKVSGSINLIETFRGEPLDWFCFFSSAQSILSAPGQSNYAAGCTFKDAIARSLRSVADFPVHIINWGYWGDIGIVATDFYRQAMANQGIHSLTIEEGTYIFEQMFSHQITQLIPMKPDDPAKKTMKIRTTETGTIFPVRQPSYLTSLTEKVKDKKVDIQHLLEEYRIFDAAFQEFILNALIQTLNRLSWDSSTPEDTLSSIQEQFNIIDPYTRWFHEIIRLLKEQGRVDSSGEMIKLNSSVKGSSPDFNLKQQSVDLIEHYPFMKGRIELAAACLEHLGEILTGAVPATDILFPKGSMKGVEGIYKDNPIADFFNNRVADIVEQFVRLRQKDLAPDQKIRILEVGAGTGGTGTFIFERLVPFKESIEYTYTDVSKSFLIYAEENYKEKAPYLKTALFNIEAPPEKQGIKVNHYDMVLAANVLHATKNMGSTLMQVKAVLKQNGLLLLNELSQNMVFATVTFGLTDGWWLFEDDEVRLPGSPGLSSEQWRTVLSEQRFYPIEYIDTDTRQLGQQIIVAENHGWVRQFNETRQSEQLSTKLPESDKTSEQIKTDQTQSLLTLKERIRQTLTRITSKALKIAEQHIDPSEQFADIGVDSIIGVEMVSTINQELAIHLHSTDLFNYPNIGRLTDHIATTYEKELFHHFGLSKVQEIIIKDNRVNEKEQISNKIGFMDQQLPRKVRSPQPDSDPIDQKDHEIAIIGISCQFGDAGSKEAYWQALKEGRSLIREVPEERIQLCPSLNPEVFFHPEPTKGKSYSKWGSFLNDIDQFDARFFSISGVEAENSDPQQRIFLQECWKAIEDSGYNPKALGESRVGVYVGAGDGDYHRGLEDKGEPSSFWGNAGSILAARISYFLNLKGPAVAIDTACSSSLVAIHLGCQSLWNRETDFVLAGGIYIQTTPKFYILSSQARMLSPDGQCFTFDDRANGFVPGEGVGVVMLKRLKDAIRDQDPIYGVIKGTAINQDGATSGITAPNVLSQKKLELDIYQSFHINPGEIQYVEAHGTGTKLGDPIEIQAISESFQKYTNKGSYCAIGSVKTNIGHTLAAAGVAGLIKVLLSLKNRQIPPSLNLETHNRHIDFRGSPFYVNTQLQTWRTDKNSPRRAAVSSFGFSGTNAHMVIEEYQQESTKVLPSLPAIIPLSAKTSESLTRYVSLLLNYLKENNGDDLYDMAYTLQTGREGMNHRIAFMVKDLKEAKEKLSQYLKGKEDIADFWQGETKSNSDGMTMITMDEDAQEMVHKWIAKGKIDKLAGLWVKGVTIDWNLLYKEVKPRRIHLPTYPFAQKRYWIRPATHPFTMQPGVKQIHPLLHENISTLEGQQYISTFVGTEFYLQDHQVLHEKVLPGVIYLEMARAAVEIAGPDKKVHKLKDIQWASPIKVKDAPQRVTISLYPETEGIAYEVTTEKSDGDGEDDIQEEATLHSQGKVMIGEPQTRPPVMDIEAIKTRCTRELNQSTCYQRFKEIGITYGPGFQRIKELRYNDHEVLAMIQAWESDNTGSFYLHPGILDSALQACIGLEMDHLKGTELYVPFALKEIEIFDKPPMNNPIYVHVTYGREQQNKAIKTYNITLLNDQGQPLIRFVDFTTRQMIGGDEDETERQGRLYESPEWRNREIKEIDLLQSSEKGDHYLFLTGRNETINEVLTSEIIDIMSHILKIKTEDIDITNDISEYGLDSIMETDFVNKINDHFKLSLIPTILYEHTTLTSFITYLIETHKGEIEEKYKKDHDVRETPHQRIDIKATDKKPLRRQRFITSPQTNPLVWKEPIAIIGMTGILPQAENLDQFWENLNRSKDCITEIPGNRWDWKVLYGDPMQEAGKTNVKWGGFIEDIDKFDPMFFGISPLEAELMDPQQRLFLQCVWHTIEHAGYNPRGLRGSQTGLFVGVETQDYADLLIQNQIQTEAYVAIGLALSIVANRISFLLDFHGPSEPISTACSSSLVAIHRAVRAIRQGDCTQAIAGGVNAILSPKLSISFSRAGMLCEDGRCKTFSDKANGYVRGEGVGAILLKPLSRAEKDGDRIYALIKGSAENHGGHANSLTAPNPTAQADLLKAAYQDADVPPDTVTYIETHGTGTALGDPIEINGLKMAFTSLYEACHLALPEAPHCALGSVKSNIGHLETAAGIAGVLKVILSMGHKTIPESLHCETINPYIDLKDTPFYIAREKQEWTSLKDSRGNTLPRRAGVSSFGFGGAYAHIVLEEYLTPQGLDIERPGVNQRVVIPLSAKNRVQLQDYARLFIDYLHHKENKKDLGDMAYTLQTGREAMESRIAFWVENLNQLEEKLAQYLKGEQNIADFWQGEVKTGPDSVTVLSVDEDAREMVDKWIVKGKINKLAEIWVKGFNIDWNLLYKEVKPGRIPLPTYPFAKERYWIPETAQNNKIQTGIKQIHPLLHENTSTLEEQQFTSTFTGTEFYLKDHQVLNESVLPGVIYLEMARAAVERSGNNMRVHKLKDIVWTTPVKVNCDPQRVSINLYPEPDGIAYEVITEKTDVAGDEEITLHSQGKVIIGESKTSPPDIDIPAIKARCSNTFTPETFYRTFQELGITYGPGFQGIRELVYNDDETLAMIQAGQLENSDSFYLHPGLLDSALQACIGLGIDGLQETGPYVPYALKEIEIFNKPIMDDPIYAHVTYSKSQQSKEIRKYDITLVNDQGETLVRFIEFTTRQMIVEKRNDDEINRLIIDVKSADISPNEAAVIFNERYDIKE